MIVLCDYCKKPAQKVTGKTIYPHRKDLHRLTFWMCDDSSHEPAYVGCHKRNARYSPNGDTPLGRLADAELRAAKSAAHRAFDPLWRDLGLFRSRSKAYNWLADKLQIPAEECHIGMLDVETCKRVEQVATEHEIDDLFDRSEWGPRP